MVHVLLDKLLVDKGIVGVVGEHKTHTGVGLGFTTGLSRSKEDCCASLEACYNKLLPLAVEGLSLAANQQCKLS